MSLVQKITRSAVAVSIASVGFVGVAAASAAPAQAQASCSLTNTGMWGLKNVSCPTIRHITVIKGGTFKYAPWAKKGQWSLQKMCWPNAVRWTAEWR